MKSETKKYLKQEFGKWMAFIEREPVVRIPFFPLAEFELGAFSGFFEELVSEIIGEEASMLSVICEDGKSLYALYEEVEQGEIVGYEMFKNKPISEITKKLGGKGKSVALVKELEISVIEQIMEAERKYEKERIRENYLLLLIGILASAVKNGKLRFAPEPKLFCAIKSILQSISVDYAFLAKLRLKLVSLEIVSEPRSLRIDLGSPIYARVKKEFVLDFLREISECEGIEAIEVAGDTIAEGIEIGDIELPLSFVWKKITPVMRRKMKKISEKTDFLLSLFANPARILLVGKGKAFLVEIKSGHVSHIKEFEVEGSLEERWLKISREHGFVHLAFKFDKLLLKTQKLEFYPRNEFVQRFCEQGLLKDLVNVVGPLVQ